MPIFDDEQLEALQDAIWRAHLEVIAQVFGVEALSPAERAVVGRDKPEGDALDEAYRYGRDTAGATSPDATRMAYAAFAAADDEALSEGEALAVLFAKRQAAQSIRGLGSRMIRETMQVVHDAEQETRQRQLVRDEIVTALEQRKTAAELAAQLRSAMGDYQRDWNRVAVTELHNARLRGVADVIRRKHGGGARVFKRTLPGACRWCIELHTGPDGAPRIFRLDELEESNVGRRKSEWTAVVGVTHPSCSCVLIHIPDGWGFDEHGQLTPDGPYGVEYASETDISKALGEERAWRKALGLPRVRYQGLSIRIENPAGSVREWHDPMTGRSGATRMLVPYGYVERTEGADGDEYGVFLGPDPAAPFVYVVHQQNPKTGEYDEDKAVLGAAHPEHAKALYLAHYDDPRFFGAMSMLTIEEFREKVGATTDPTADGMIKGDEAAPRYTPGPTLSVHVGAADAAAGNRNVQDGVTGPNIAHGSPPAARHAVDAAARHEQIEDFVEERAAEGQRARDEQRKRTARNVETVTRQHVEPRIVPYESSAMRGEMTDEALKDTPRRRAFIETQLAERNRSVPESPHSALRLFVRPSE
jgi:hypothetical protein